MPVAISRMRPTSPTKRSGLIFGARERRSESTRTPTSDSRSSTATRATARRSGSTTGVTSMSKISAPLADPGDTAMGRIQPLRTSPAPADDLLAAPPIDREGRSLLIAGTQSAGSRIAATPESAWSTRGRHARSMSGCALNSGRSSALTRYAAKAR